MKSRKRGEIEIATAVTSPDKHKLWLIIGIILAVILVLVIIFLSPARQALFGKAVSLNPPAPMPSSTNMPSSGLGIEPTGTTPRAAIPCMDIQLLPVRTGKTTALAAQSTLYRKEVCQSSPGCTFSGVETPPNPGNDRCIGSTTVCPNVALYLWSGSVYETGRQQLCEAQGCVFTSGGTDFPAGDRCEPRVRPSEVCNNNVDDDGNNLIDCAEHMCAGQFGDNKGSLCGATEVSCIDNFDNDRDGVVDCADNDCAGIRIDDKGSVCEIPERSCGDTGDNDGDNLIDCADSDCAGNMMCAAQNSPTQASPQIPAQTRAQSDVDGDGSTSSSDVTFLLYILRAQSDSVCGGAGQTICDYSDDGIFACDSGTAYAMASETDRAHATDTCGGIIAGDINGDGVVDSSDVTFLLYILRAQSDSVCGGAGQTICDYSDDGIFACDSGTAYAMASETDRAHAIDICS